MRNRRGAVVAVVAVVAAVAAIAAGLTTILPSLNSSGVREGSSRRAIVTAVLDGDTLRVEGSTGQDLGRVRLLGIDAPEIAHRRSQPSATARPPPRCWPTSRPSGRG